MIIVHLLASGGGGNDDDKEESIVAEGLAGLWLTASEYEYHSSEYLMEIENSGDINFYYCSIDGFELDEEMFEMSVVGDQLDFVDPAGNYVVTEVLSVDEEGNLLRDYEVVLNDGEMYTGQFIYSPVSNSRKKRGLLCRASY